MESNQISQILTIVLVIMVVIVVVMAIIYFVLLSKERERKKIREEEERKEREKNKETINNSPEMGNVLDFMEFEDITDNMIIQKEKKKYLMVIECQGVNYDLMSKVEKNSVEQGFLQFLNTLRHPIQLYVQTRAINLENTIERYKKCLKDIESTYIKKRNEYKEIKNNPRISEEIKKKKLYELTKSTNLYEYGKDIIRDTERMSLNNNILNKKYYIIISYYYENQNVEVQYTKEEIRNRAFTDLYTKAQALIRTLTACSVKGRILDSVELAELLYMAYNRDGAESYGIERALKASYDKIYSTAPDIFTKRMQLLDKEIEKKAIERAQAELARAKSEKEKAVEKKEAEKDRLIKEMAKMILEQNKKYVGKEITERAIKKIEEEEDSNKQEDNNKQEGGKNNV